MFSLSTSRLWLALFAATALTSGLACAAPPTDSAKMPAQEYQLVWHDEFDGTTLDSSKWSIRQPGPRFGGFNTLDNAKLDGQGDLVITMRRESPDKITTAMISTDGKYAPRYGYYECRVKVQHKSGNWTAFWLQSPDMSQVGNTRKNGTEIDIYEYAVPMKAQVMSNLHWFGYGKDHRTTGKHSDVEGLNAGYHVFGCEWTPDHYRFFSDGKLTWETTEAPSDHPEYLILSAEVPVQNTATWAGRSETLQGEDQVIFDYVRVYQTPEQMALNAKKQ